jgi:hypothetical protein
MGVRANRAKNLLVALRDPADRIKGFSARRDGDDPLQSCGSRAANHGIPLRGKIWEIEVAVSIDQHDFSPGIT